MADTPDSGDKPAPQEAMLRTALESADVPKLYANGFFIGLSNADIFVVFSRFGQNPTAVVNLSYTLAKTLAQRLGQVVSEFENTIGQTLVTTDKIDEAVKNAQKVKAKVDDSVH